MVNNYTGEVIYNMGGKAYVIVYDWKAIAEAQSRFGNDIIESFNKSPSPEMIAGMLEIGMRKHHPEMTAQAIIDSSPPFIPAIQAVSSALLVAWFGADGVPDDNSPQEKKRKKTT